MIIVSVLVAILAIVLLLPTLSDLVSIAAVTLGARPLRDGAAAPGELPRILFMVPAHDESAVIEACVRSLLNVEYPEECRQIVVIADNCTDDTADVVESLGALALRRHVPEAPGKPQAIEWALSRVGLTNFDAVCIVDADATADPSLARELATMGPWRGVAAQAYDGLGNPEASALTRMSNVFTNARYLFLYPLKERAGLNVPLMGNGMIFSTDILVERGWDAFSICEDWEMYALLTAEGYPIIGNPRARVYAQEADALEQSGSQRERWAAGKMTVFLRETWPLLRSRKVGWRQKLDALGELTHVGPAVHLGVVGLASAAIFLLHLPWAVPLVALLGGSLVRTIVVSAVSIPFEPRPLATLGSFVFLPFYTVWRLLVQVRALGMLGDKPWVKTKRNA
jgi:cellulose synthase/poly-beta-1,6-N-acetylglucosamine synthase-like glycosyltransferase